MTVTASQTTTGPRPPALDRAIAMRLAATEYERFAAVLAALSGPDWRRATECPGWDVRAMATHVLGTAEMAASVRENLRQNRAARRRGGLFIDALTELQVQERAGTQPAEIVARFTAVGPRAARGRRRTPGLIRRRPMPGTQPVGAVEEAWTFGFLIDVILTRDTWMHRIDICRAVAVEPVLSAEHDGVLVADVVAEWAQRHASSFVLRLTGPAGGTWTSGADGPQLELDAVEFCRILSGRVPAEGVDGLLAVEVPF